MTSPSPAPSWSTEQWYVPAESAFPDSPHTVPDTVPLDPAHAERYWCLWDNHRLPPGEKTVFLGDRNTEKLQEYLRAHRGRHIFFLIERHRLETLRGVLPAEARSSLEIVDDSNNKVYLARAQL